MYSYVIQILNWSTMKFHIYDIYQILTNDHTGVDFMARSGIREYEEEKLCFPACCRQDNATYSPHIHQT